MRNKLFDVVEKKYHRTAPVLFDIGDTVVVTIRIIEGEKERLQDFEGDVIARRGRGLDEMFTVRRLVGDEGVERIFAVHSPKIAAVKIKRSGRTRRAKLFFLRDRVGRARKLKERRVSADARKAAAEAKAAKAKAIAEADAVVASSKREPALANS